MRRLGILYGLIVWCVLAILPARAEVTFNSDSTVVPLTGHMQFLSDDSSRLALDDVLRAEQQGRLLALPQNLNRGFTTMSSWLSFVVANNGAVPCAPVLLLMPPFLDTVEVFVQTGNDATNPAHYTRYNVGDRTPMADKPLPYAQIAVPIQLEPDTRHTIFLRVQTTSTHALRAELLSPAQVLKRNAHHNTVHAAYEAIAATLAIINFLLFLRLRDRVHALYGIYLLTLLIGNLGIENMIALWWPAQAHHLSDWLTGLGTGLGFSSICLFTMALLKTRQWHPWVHRYLLVISAMGAATALTSGSVWYGQITPILIFNGPVIAFLLPWLAWRMICRGEVATGRFIFASFAASAIGATIAFLRILGLLPINDITVYSLQATSVIHMILMMQGLSERVLAAESSLREAARQAESSAMALAGKMTQELVESKHQLERSLDTERRMREEQGRFIDTITHEYRTPLSILRTHLDVMQAKRMIDAPRLETMGGALRRLQDIFSDALDAHRLGRPPAPRMENFDFARLLGDVLVEFHQSFPECVVNTVSSLPSALVFGDSALLKTALRNLLDNARKYRYPTSTPVEVDLVSNAGWFTLSVCNAIDPDAPLNRGELFERYVRGSTRGKLSGMGLGLYLVKRILHDHGGEATISDGQSDRFEIRLTLPPARG